MKQIKNLLITGPPGVGKTTLIKQLLFQLQNLNPVGFYTTEIRNGGRRKGFRLKSLDGATGILSHTSIDLEFSVGKYSVDLSSFDQFLEHIPFFDDAREITVIDEIGTMELFSDKFRKIVNELLNSDRPFIATITLKDTGFTSEVKNRIDTELFKLKNKEEQIVLSSTIIERIYRIISK